MPFLETIGSASAQAYGIAGSSSPTGLYPFPSGNTITFTPGSATSLTGPTLAQAIAGMSSSTSLSWNTNTAYFNMTTQGQQLWTVPITGTYTLQLAGAKGGNSSVTGGSGGIITTNSISLIQGQIIRIGCGQIGLSGGDGTGAGGGGASWIYNQSTGTLIAIVGGGGGGGISGVTGTYSNTQNNSTGNGQGGGSSGGQDTSGGGTSGGGGTNGSGNTCGWGGSGWLYGTSSSPSCARGGGVLATAISSTAIGGTGDSGSASSQMWGGFGGGGAGAGNCGYGGGGGGYSGGGGGTYGSGCGGPGGSGGSFSNFGFNWNGNNSSAGYVIVTRNS